MKLTQYFATREGAMRENNFSRYIIVLLAVAIVVMAWALSTKQQTVVLVPPTLSEKVELSGSTVSDPYKTSWGLFFATLLGNVTPRSAEYVQENISKYAHPNAYKLLLEQITAQTELIETDKLTIQFTPTTVFYAPAIDRVVVTGEYVLRGLRDAEQRMLRTYELGIDVKNYMVSLSSIVAYEGPWVPDRDLKEELARQEEARKAREAKARAAASQEK